VLVDAPGAGRRFLVLGSASPDLLRQTSETLAGRIAYHELAGFAVSEVGAARASTLWRRGGFPRSFLAGSDLASMQWRRQFIRTFLEREIPNLGLRLPAATLRRFWMMLAHYHAQVWNASELARAFAVAHTTVRHYLDVLTATFMVRQLQPWHENIGKRQVRAPKVYVRDSGLLHALLGLATQRQIESHPKVGASWEGFALDVVTSQLRAEPEECYFWATHSGAELDLLVMRGRQRLGFEFKRTTTPAVTRSMRVAVDDLRLTRLFVVHAGTRSFPLAPGIQALALSRVLEDLPAPRRV
jgi:predicted AAA+ superfamily ATPase